MSDRDALQDLLKTVKPLALSGLKTPVGMQAGPAGLTNSLAQRWVTKQRLIERLLAETDIRNALDRFETRTREFTEKHPDQPGWRDKSGQEWRAALVLQAAEEIREHLDSWDADDDFGDDDDADGGDWDDDTD
jgi:hypothetical protein